MATLLKYLLIAMRLDFLQADRPKNVTGTDSSHNHSHTRGYTIIPKLKG
jgi:hypothetical protein